MNLLLDLAVAAFCKPPRIPDRTAEALISPRRPHAIYNLGGYYYADEMLGRRF